jgi:aryl-alcohol dehydrogenase-like predicted oxidoreductase
MTLPTRVLGSTGFEITGLGLGAWAIGGGGWQGGWGPQDDNESIAAIHRAIERGINWIDTAPAYGLGHAEEVVGRALAAVPIDERPLVFTKCGLVWRDRETTVSNVLEPASIRRECESSLRRLRLERLDLLQIHWPSTDGTPPEESWGTMAELVEEGLVRAIGVSNYDLELLEVCNGIRRVDTYQPELNLLHREAAATAIPWCMEHGTGVIVYSPMRSGLLTGRFSAERAAALPHDDWRRADPDFRPPRLARNLEFVERLRPIALEIGTSLPKLAVAWTLACPGVTGAIVGARRPEQVDGWIGAAELQLDDEALTAIALALGKSDAGSGPRHPAAIEVGR